MMLDQFTFGNSPASQLLVDILSKKDNYVIRKITRSLCQLNYILNCILQIDDIEIRKHLLILKFNSWKENILNSKSNHFVLDEKLRSFLINAAQTNFKKKLRGDYES